MTSTAATTRGFAIVTAALAAVALVAGLTPTVSPASASPSAMAAKSKAATAMKTTAGSSRNTKSSAAASTSVKAAAVVASPTDFTSIFAAQQPALTNAGWTTCPAPITWSVDASGLTAAETSRQIANIQAAFAQWSAVSGLAFQYAGTATFTYNESSFSLTRTDGTTPTRNINLAFIDDAASSLLGGTTVGMAGPSSVWMDSKQIVAGTGVFRIDAVRKMTDTQAQALYTHELGHVLGLGHAAESAEIMNPVVGDNATLGAGDITGVRTMVKPCPEA